MNNYIIGGGIAGLVAAFYKKDHILLSGMDMGQMGRREFSLGPRILEKTEATEQFMFELYMDKIIPMSRTFKTGFFYKGLLYTYMTEKMSNIYSIKTRGVISDYRVGNNGQSKIHGWPITEELITTLTAAVQQRIIACKVIKIYPASKQLEVQNPRGDLETINYDNLVSTIPLNALTDLVGLDLPLIYTHKHFYKIRFKWNFHHYDFVYVIDDSAPFHRIMKIDENHILLEANDELNMEELKETYGFLNNFEHVRLQVGQIVNDLKLTDYRGIKLLGRFAQWDHRIRTADVIRRAGGAL